MQSASGAGMFPGKMAQARVVRSQARPAERVLASLLNSLCYPRAPRYLLSVIGPSSSWAGQQGPHPLPWPQHPRRPGMKAGASSQTHLVSPTTTCQQYLLKPPHLLPPVSKKVCSTHTHTLTQPKSSTTRLFKNECLHFQRPGQGKSAS